MRVLVTTDNHVGYNETDAVRGDDAARTFDEVLAIARARDVDLVLQAGDLFHVNRPSKRSLFAVMRSLRRHVLGDRPVALEAVHTGSLGPAGAPELAHPNWEDPNVNVAVPVFAISGNHDDAGGAGAAVVAPMDLLAAAGLLNHFGAVPDNDDIVVDPVLLRHGATRLALYGIAAVRDERLHRSFRAGRVRFLRPRDDPDAWTSILMVHQNHTSHTPTNFLPEQFLPSFLDLVIWGHEHECLIEPVTNPVTGFRVMQPGSSVATSLSDSETAPKQVALLHIDEKEIRVEPVPLRTVRPFVMDTVALADSGIPPARDARARVHKWLVARVDALIEQALAEWNERNGTDTDTAGAAGASSDPGASPEPSAPPLPLVRLRVDYSGGYDVENPTRFSNKFVGRVANANDVVQYFKRTAKTAAGRTEAPDAAALAAAAADPDKVELSELVREFLQKQRLEVLPEAELTAAIGKFVDKDDKSALKLVVDGALELKLKAVLGPGAARAGNKGDKSTAAAAAANSDDNEPDEPARGRRRALRSQPIVLPEDDAAAEAHTARHAALLATSDSDEMDVDDDGSDAEFVESDEPAPRRAAPARKAAARPAAKPRAAAAKAAPKPRAAPKAAVKAAPKPRARAAAAAAAAPEPARKRVVVELNDDEVDSDDGFS